jgi:RNA polymerase sigma-70 factor (ECF subfamily)
VADAVANSLPDALRAGGTQREVASQQLRDLLVRAALAYLARQRYPAEALGADDYASAAEDFAQEALAIILRQLDAFRGQARFTTWAYRIVINLVADELRRRAWRRQALDERAADRAAPGPADAEPALVAERRVIRDLIHQSIREDLTPRQRHVLVGRYFADKPLVVLAGEVGADKDAVYKLLYDARRQLKRALLARGLTMADVWSAFG